LANFTLLDIFGTLRVLPFFALIFLAPGYCVGRVSNVLDFRRRSAAEQWLWSMGISIVVAPIILNLLSRWLPLHVTIALCWFLVAAAAGDLLRRWRTSGFPIGFHMRRLTAIACGLAAIWAVICLLSLPDLQLGHRLYSTAAVADLSHRTAFVASAMLGGAPPSNPFFYPGSPVGLRYYYYWYVITAIPGAAAGVEPRTALFASSIWCGWLLAAAAALFLKHFYGVRRHIRIAGVAAMALLGVTGLDVLYVLVLYLKYKIVLSDMEVWDTDQVTSWTNSLLWVPHHVAATIACMLGFVFLWHAGRSLENTLRQRVLLAVLAAMGFASAAGLSVYVTLAFALFLTTAALFWLATRRFKTLALYIMVAMLVVLLSASYLRDLRATGTRIGDSAADATAVTQHQPPIAKLALRQLPPTLMPVLRHAVHENKLANILLRPFLLVPIMFLEFGFFFLVAVRQGRQDWGRDWGQDWRKGRNHATAELPASNLLDLRDIRWLSWLMLLSGLWVALMMRSTVIMNNDLSYRGVEIAQFILLVWGAAQIAGARPEVDVLAPSMETPRLTQAAHTPLRIGWLAGSLLFIGIISSAYQLVMLRFYLYGSDRYNWTNPVIPESEFGGRFGAINQELRDAYASLDRVLPPSAKVQFGAAPKLDLQHLYYSRYQALDGMFPGCGTAFGGSEAECFQLGARIAPIFGMAEPPPGTDPYAFEVTYVPTLKTASDIYSLCRDLGIDALVVTGEDPVWNDPNGWPHQMTPVFASDFVAAYTCR
jgi:hypothetical protein